MVNFEREIRRFIFVGLIVLITDMSIYYTLIKIINYDVAKVIAFVFGTIVAFVLNKLWTFQKYQKKFSEVWQFIVLYTFALLVNVVTNHFVIDLTNLIFFSYLVATTMSTMINFLGQKLWVFR